MVRGTLSATKHIVQSKGGQNTKYSHSFAVTINSSISTFFFLQNISFFSCGTGFIFHMKEEDFNITLTKLEPDISSIKVRNVVPNMEVHDVFQIETHCDDTSKTKCKH